MWVNNARTFFDIGLSRSTMRHWERDAVSIVKKERDRATFSGWMCVAAWRPKSDCTNVGLTWLPSQMYIARPFSAKDAQHSIRNKQWNKSYRQHRRLILRIVRTNIESSGAKSFLLPTYAKRNELFFKSSELSELSHQSMNPWIQISKCSFDVHRHQSLHQPGSIISGHSLSYGYSRIEPRSWMEMTRLLPVNASHLISEAT